MSLLGLIVVLVVVGLLMYLINAFIPMEARIKQILNVAVIIFLIIWFLQALGVLNMISGVRLGK